MLNSNKTKTVSMTILRTQPPQYPIGYVLKNTVKTIPFLQTQIIIHCAHITHIPPGIWSISFGWKMSSTGTMGDGANNNVKYGLSKNANLYDLIEINSVYNIKYDDPTTYQSYYHNIVLSFTTDTCIFFNASLNNISEDVDTLINDSFLSATLISY
jgi:hypothetical protein